MGFRACDPLGTHDQFIGLGLLWNEHLYKGPGTRQEDGLLTQPSKYFSYLLVTKENSFTSTIPARRRETTTREPDIRYPL